MPQDAERLRLLYDLGCAFAAQVDLDALSRLVVRKCREVFDAEAASILLLDAERGELYFPYVDDADGAVADRLLRLRFPADRGIAGAVLNGNAPVCVNDVRTDARFYAGIDRASGLTTRSLLCAPLRAQSGPIGVIQVLNRRADAGFTEEDGTFLDALGGSIAVAIENARLYAQLRRQMAALEQAVREHNELVALHRELDVACAIQQSIVPQTFPPFPDRHEFDLYATMVPAREVGGDFYDFFLIDPHHLGLVIGDVSGKGIPAALFMAVSRTLLKATALMGAAPAACLQRVNGLLCAENAADMFVTVTYAILNTQSGQLEYGTGGHPPPIIVRGGGAVEPLPPTRGGMLGIWDDATYQAGRAVLARGDAVFLFTDGISEAMDAAGAVFSEERLGAVLAGCTDHAPKNIIRSVVEAVQRHAGDVPQSDDVTALAVRFLGA